MLPSCASDSRHGAVCFSLLEPLGLEPFQEVLQCWNCLRMTDLAQPQHSEHSSEETATLGLQRLYIRNVVQCLCKQEKNIIPSTTVCCFDFEFCIPVLNHQSYIFSSVELTVRTLVYLSNWPAMLVFHVPNKWIKPKCKLSLFILPRRDNLSFD